MSKLATLLTLPIFLTVAGCEDIEYIDAWELRSAGSAGGYHIGYFYKRDDCITSLQNRADIQSPSLQSYTASDEEEHALSYSLVCVENRIRRNWK
jgi:hypothetical protein